MAIACLINYNLDNSKKEEVIVVCFVLHLLLLFALDWILLTGVIIKTFLGNMFSIVLKTNT